MHILAESEKFEIGGQPVVNQCNGILFTGHKAANAPRWSNPSKKARGVARLQTHIETIEGDLQAAAVCLEVSLFAGPAQKKSFSSFPPRKLGQRLPLMSRKIMLRNIIAFDIRANSFNVYPNTSIPAEGKTATSSE